MAATLLEQTRGAMRPLQAFKDLYERWRDPHDVS